jgi:hypothetical protein
LRWALLMGIFVVVVVVRYGGTVGGRRRRKGKEQISGGGRRRGKWGLGIERLVEAVRFAQAKKKT